MGVKLCECGCGQPAPIAKRTDRSRGRVRGEPVRFIQGHNVSRPSTGPNEKCCVRCGHERIIKAKGLCRSCYVMSVRVPATEKLTQRERIAALREHGLTWAQVAEEMSVSETHVRRLADAPTCPDCGTFVTGEGRRCISCSLSRRRGIEAERVRPLLVAEVTRLAGSDWEHSCGGRGTPATFSVIAFRCRVDESTLRKIVWRVRGRVSFETLDSILTGLDLVHLSHLPAELGGFADVYDKFCAAPVEEKVAA